MLSKNVNLIENIVEATKSSTIKEVCYVSCIFKQNVYTNANGDTEVEDQDIDVNLKLDIPTHSFVSFINVLLELRKNFDVACAYSKVPISHENELGNNDNKVGDRDYVFCYWNSYHNNVLFSNMNRASANVFIYLSEFNSYANLYVTHKKNNNSNK